MVTGFICLFLHNIQMPVLLGRDDFELLRDGGGSILLLEGHNSSCTSCLFCFLIDPDIHPTLFQVVSLLAQ